MGKKSSSYSQIDPRVGQAMSRQADLALQLEDFNENTMMPAMFAATEKDNERKTALGNFAKELAYFQREQTRENTDKQNARSDAAYNTGLDLKKGDKNVAADATYFNEDAYKERMIEEAIADLTMGYGQQRKYASQQYNQLGIDPTSGRFQSGFRQISDEEANNKAQAKLAAEKAAKELGWNKRMTAVGIGQDYLNQSINYGNLANSTISSGMSQVLSSLGNASNSSSSQLSNLGSMYSSYGSNLSSLMNQNQSIFSTGMGVSNTNLQQSISNNQAAMTAASGYGSAIGSIAGASANTISRAYYAS